jgi:uncharacterized protein YegP (UPF0339 family)
MAKKQTYELYVDNANEWRWRLLSENGNNLGNSGEGYKNFTDAFNIVARIKKESDDVRIIKEDPDTKELLVEKKAK